MNRSAQNLYSCLNCDFRANAPVRCPRCDKWSLRTPDQIRSGGIVLVLLGLFLTGVMLFVILLASLIVLSQPADISDLKVVARFVFLYSILFGVTLFGATFLVEGIWRVMTGCSSRKAMKIILTLAILMWLCGLGARTYINFF